MTNLFPNKIRTKQTGVSILIITVILLVASTLIVIFATNYSWLQTKTAANFYRSNQSFEAAEAGLEFGIPYLIQNKATIIANPVNGFIPPYSDGSTTNVTLANNSRFTVVYTNPIAFNYALIKLTVTGVNEDNSSTDTITQLVNEVPLLINPPTNPASSLGPVSLGGTSTILNLTSHFTVRSGSTVSITGTAVTLGSNSTSNASSMGSDVQQNYSGFQGMTDSDFFNSYFGMTEDEAKSPVSHFYAQGSSPNLAGMTGTSIWVDDDLSITGTTTVGSASNPVLLFVNGNFSISGGATIYGFLFATGNVERLTGNSQIIGAVASAGSLTLHGLGNVTFNPTVLNNLQTQTANNFAKVGGTWKDF